MPQSSYKILFRASYEVAPEISTKAKLFPHQAGFQNQCPASSPAQLVEEFVRQLTDAAVEQVADPQIHSSREGKGEQCLSGDICVFGIMQL